MDLYKINFDIGKVDYYVDHHLIQEYSFFSFYEVCELVFACHLPAEDLLLNVVTKEKIIPIIDCYVDRLVVTFLRKDDRLENYALQMIGNLFRYPFIREEVERSFEKYGLSHHHLTFVVGEKREGSIY